MIVRNRDNSSHFLELFYPIHVIINTKNNLDYMSLSDIKIDYAPKLFGCFSSLLEKKCMKSYFNKATLFPIENYGIFVKNKV